MLYQKTTLTNARLKDKPKLHVKEDGTVTAKFTISKPRREHKCIGNQMYNFFNCTAFGVVARNCVEFLNAGDRVNTEVYVDTSTWSIDVTCPHCNHKFKGGKHYAYECEVIEIEFLDSKQKAAHEN